MTKQEAIDDKEPLVRGSDNRARLVSAACRVLSEKGYEATTVKEIARAAGVSPGLFHYYFASKDELLLDVLKQASEQFGEAIAEFRAALPATRFIEAAMNQAQEQIAREPHQFRLRYELFALGLRNPAFLPAVGELLAGGRQRIAQSVQAVTGDGDEGDRARTDALATLLLACFDGLALQLIAQPDLDFTATFEILGALISFYGALPAG